MKGRRITWMLLLSSLMLFVTLISTTAASAKAAQQPAQSRLLVPVITPADGSVKHLDSRGCFEAAIHGSYFTPSTFRVPQYADLYASDLTGDSLTLYPLYARLNSSGAFTREFYVCGVSFPINLVTFVAVDDMTGANSNPLPVGISPVYS